VGHFFSQWLDNIDMKIIFHIKMWFCSLRRYSPLHAIPGENLSRHGVGRETWQVDRGNAAEGAQNFHTSRQKYGAQASHLD